MPETTQTVLFRFQGSEVVRKGCIKSESLRNLSAAKTIKILLNPVGVGMETRPYNCKQIVSAKPWLC